MINGEEYTKLLLRKQELLQEQETYIDNRNNAKKHLAEINFRHDLQKLGEMCENISEKGDSQLLKLIIESRGLMRKQEKDIERLAEAIDRDYFTKVSNCEDKLYAMQRQLGMMSS